MSEVDDELISCYIDKELAPAEFDAVARLVEVDEAWHERHKLFQRDVAGLRKMPAPELTESLRQKAFEYAESDVESGMERRRVPRFKRRWMMAAALLLPAALTLLFFQNPNSTSRLYLKKEGLELQAGRSIAEQDVSGVRRWKSPKLWGSYDHQKFSALSYQLDAEEKKEFVVNATVTYDFNGDGQVERTEVYEASELDERKGFERFSPDRTEETGAFKNFDGGEIWVIFEFKGKDSDEVKLSRNPGELIVPFNGLRSSKGAYDQ